MAPSFIPEPWILTFRKSLTRVLVLTVFGFCLGWVPRVSAQCPGTLMVRTFPGGTHSAQAMSANTGSPGPLYLFIGATTTSCTTAKFGTKPPTRCQLSQNTSGATFFTAGLVAVWPAVPPTPTAHGCVFNCPGGTCRVRGGDGLPVELMGFSVDGDADSEDDPETATDPETDEPPA